MKVLSVFIIGAILILMPFGPAFGQIELKYATNIVVHNNGRAMAFPFAGGLNAGQYGTIDLNNDDLADLVIFDRSSNKLNTFINTGNAYSYQPEFEHFFPEGIQNWIVFADYNCDGAKDIFTHSNLGIKVYTNVSNSAVPAWELRVDPLLTLGTSSMVNLFLNATDVPSIADLDGDNDLDVLVYNFSAGAFIEHHKNFSVERTGNCGSLDFERISRNYGNVEECTCGEFAFGGQGCASTGRIQHSGGKTILALDRDGDGDKEIIIGQELCDDIYALENKGSGDIAIFDDFTDAFPEASGPINMVTFPAPYSEDLDFDGLNDIVVAPNLRSNPGNLIDLQNSSWLFKNVGTSSLPQFQLVKKNFLQDEMIDVGDFAYPTFTDIDGDGDQDLIIGNLGSHTSNGFLGTLTLYRNNGTQLEFVTADYAGLSTLGLTYVKPDFADMSGDGKLDLVFTGLDQNNDFRYHYLENTSNSSTFEFDPPALQTIPFVLNPSDDPVIYDIDGDGLLDILLGRSNGRLEYYRNVGVSVSPNFQLENSTFLGLDFSSANGNLSLDIGDIDNDGLVDLLTTDRSGVMKVYLNFINNQSQTPLETVVMNDQVSQLQTTVLGRHTKPALARLFGANNLVVAMGSIQGGIRLLVSSDAQPPASGLELTVFPNPSQQDKVVQFLTPNAEAQLEVFDVSGKRIHGPVTLSASVALPVNLFQFRNGLYFARLRKAGQTTTTKFLLGAQSGGL